jgi:hypothetical protein
MDAPCGPSGPHKEWLGLRQDSPSEFQNKAKEETPVNRIKKL